MIHRDGHLRSTDSEFLFRRMVRVVTEGPVRGRNVSMILRHKVSAFSELPLVFRGA